MSEPKKKTSRRKFTYAEYRTWPDDERWELIDGEAYDMTPTGTRPHSLVITNLGNLLYNGLKGGPCEVHIGQLEVRLPKRKKVLDEKIEDVVIPDIAVVCDASKLDEKGCRGAPDFVAEVLSPSTSSYDHIKKKALYERHGVKEYWLIDPVNRVIIAYILTDAGVFGPAQIYAVDSIIDMSFFEGLTIKAVDIFPPDTRVVRESPRAYLAARAAQKKR